MAKGDKKTGRKNAAQEPVKDTTVAKPIENKTVASTEESCPSVESCPMKKCCCAKSCRCKCCPLCFLIFTVLFIMGFVLFLVIRDDPTVTFDLCKTDIQACFKNICTAVKPYLTPREMIQFLRVKGYIN